jgi:3-dehydroquinate dehydratase/shikimate dehydrogenase
LLHKAGGDSIVIVMGEAGQISRILAGKLGAFLTFASLEADAATAPGQVTLDDMLNLYRFRSQTGKTEVYGVVASPVRHSLSPAIHNACFAKSAMDKVYLPLLVEGGRLEFFEFMQNVLNRPWLNFRGLSVTIPHKENAFEFVEHTGGFIEPLASRIGAINTITIGLNERVSGFNTDCQGAIDAITAGMAITKKELHGVPVAVLGAGGVSRAVIAGLIDAGAHVTIYNRTLSKAQGVAGEFGCCFAAMEEFEKASARLVVNCTSVGMHPVVDQSPIPAAAINKDMVVFDTIYNPTQTKLLSEARAAGAKIIGGIEMFINQALEQFRLFTGKDADPEVMRQIIAEKLLAS